MLLDEGITRAKHELASQRRGIHSKSSLALSEKRTKGQLMTLERKLEISQTKTSSVASENKTTRELINKRRREKMNAIAIIAGYNADLEELEKQADDKSLEALKSVRVDERQ
jgi:hypothetical protein